MSAPAHLEPREIRTDEAHESLWWLAASPALWVLHFLLSYGSAAIACGKDPGSGPPRALIAIFTGLALAAIAAVGARGYLRHRFVLGPREHDFDTPAGRTAFLGFAIFLLSVMAAIGVVFVALPAVYFESCR